MMASRLFSFSTGALFGAAGAVINCRLGQSAIPWGIVDLAARVRGVLAVRFGDKFCNEAVDIWPL